MNSKEQSGFRLPEDYFKRFPERLKEHMEATDKPALPEDPGFRVPENYFGEFESRLNRRMQQPKGKLRQLWGPVLGWSAAAAAAVLLTLVFWPARQADPTNFEDLAATEIEAYLEAGFDQISAYELAEALPLEAIEMEDVMETGAREDQILEYLNEDDATLEELYLEENE